MLVYALFSRGPVMNQALLFLHFVGLMLGAAGGLASGIVMRKAMAMKPEEGNVIRGLGPLLANVAALGVVVLWATGLIMVWTGQNGLGAMPAMFWIKMIFVVLLTILVGATHATYAAVRRGNAAAAARLPKLGPVSGASSLLAVLFAVIAFG